MSQLKSPAQNSRDSKTGLIYISWLALTENDDVARVESKTYMVTNAERDTRPTPKDGLPGELSNWMSPDQYKREFDERFPNCMKGAVSTTCTTV